MKASELIKQLEKLIKKHADVEVRVHNPFGESYEDNFQNINIVHIDFDDGEGIEVMETVEEHFVIEAW
jgi:hypothetical protein